MDQGKAKELDCARCDRASQNLRNCSGSGRPAMIVLNDALYPRCPRATYLESTEARYIVQMYFYCKRTSTFPFGNAPAEQTHFVTEAFDYIAELIAIHDKKILEASKAKQKV